MGGLTCDDTAREKFKYEKLPHFRYTNDALALTSVSIALQNVELTAQCS